MIQLFLMVAIAQSRKVSQTALNMDNLIFNKEYQHDKEHKPHDFKIKVPGTGLVDLLPSIGTVIFAIEIQDADAKAALQQANDLVDSAVSSIKYYLNSDNHEIETGIFQLSLRYDYSSGTQQLIGYTVTNQIYITTTDLKLIGKIITVGINAGLNRIDGVNYSNNDQETSDARDEATKAAIKDATRKADLVAHALGKKVAEIVKFKFINSYSDEVTRGYGPEAAGTTAKSNNSPTPVYASKGHIRVDIELKVRLE